MPTNAMPIHVNTELLSWTPLARHHVLEIGCGVGGFGRVYKNQNPSAMYTGVEMREEFAKMAAPHLNNVIVGDIEHSTTLAKIDLSMQGHPPFDLLVLDGLLECLKDPWAVMGNLRSRMAVDGVCCVSVHNVAHWSVLLQQLKGRWDDMAEGVLNPAHIRHFTLETALLHKSNEARVPPSPRRS
jgi:tRNA A58 N-methylase Trm61